MLVLAKKNFGPGPGPSQKKNVGLGPGQKKKFGPGTGTTLPISTRPGQRSKMICGESEGVFSPIENLLGESLEAPSTFKVTKSPSHLELLFVLCKIRH